MPRSSSGEWEWAERWDQLYEALSAEPRREILISLSEAPKERRLPLPEAAASPNQSMDPERLSTELCHHHLPKLEEAGYVRWERDPFCVQRGPHFAEPALIVETVLDSVDQIPPSLMNNCKVLQERADDGSV